MKKIIMFLILTLTNTQILADHFPEFPPFPVTAIQTHTIMEGDEVFFGYGPGRYPCLERLANTQGIFQYVEFVGNDIEITVSALGNFPCFDLDTDLIAYEFYNLGAMPAGVYNIQMYWTSPSRPLPVLNNDTDRIPIGGIVQFEVFAPQIIPSLTFISLLFISGVIIMTTTLFKKKSLYNTENPLEKYP